MRTIYILAIAICLMFTGCTSGFRDMNSDSSGITDDELEIDNNDHGIRLDIIQQGIYFNYDFGKGKNWTFQLTQNLCADMYSGYLHDAKPLNGGTHNSDYNLQDGWNSAMWIHVYAYIFPQIYQSEKSTRNSHDGFFGVTKTLKVVMMQRVTDYYGPIVYSNFADAAHKYMPDSQKEVYEAFFTDLDSAQVAITKYIQENPKAPNFARFDRLLDGRYQSWLRYINSLRMRLAVRIAMADPVKAQAEFMKGLNGKQGCFESGSETVTVAIRDGYINPLGEINRGWNEAYMNASMESILNGYADPRRARYFEKCTAESFRGQYRGIRQGTCFAHTQYQTGGLSKPAIDQTTPPMLMNAAEVWFLRAEAALRGWTSENVGNCYENGIRCSFEHLSVGDVAQYLRSEKMAADFVDTHDQKNNIKARCRVSPRWDDGASQEEKLEKIITQKWIALFPEGCEAWAEQRRTGYPRLFPVRFNNSRNGSIDTETMIRRLNFPGKLSTENADQYNALVEKLGGSDNAGTRLWWDTGRNF